MYSKKRKASAVAYHASADVLKFTPLGAGQEVGRSCLMIEFKGKTVMLDCGLHPAYTGLPSLPFIDEVDPSKIDLLLITHFHIDHAAGLPYFLEKTSFKGRVFMTHPTKAIFKWMLSDYVKISNIADDNQLYDEKDLLNAYEKIEVIDYHQELNVNGIKFTPYNAGHVLGAAMFLIEIAGVKIFYTGDYSREEDRHLMSAECPNISPDILICESTFGVQTHEPRLEREARFTNTIHDIVSRGGRCLLPVFALGRAQELLLILDEYWQAHAELHNIPIYYASSLAKKCMAVYQTYINMMNSRIRARARIGNPFQFKHISNLKSITHFDDTGPCVMMASPAMLQNGLSRELLELWCPDKKNGVIIPGYVVEGTLGKDILSQPEDIVSLTGKKLPLNLTVEYVSFAAHVDFKANTEFIEAIGAPNLILVHGDSNEMGRLRSALHSRFNEKEKSTRIFTPKNCETVSFHFRGEKRAKFIGSIIEDLQEQNRVSGILLSKDYSYHLLNKEDIPNFTSILQTSFKQRQVIKCNLPLGIVKWHIKAMCYDIEDISDRSLIVCGAVQVTLSASGKYCFEWEGDGVSDLIADSLIAILCQAETSPATIKQLM